MTPIPRFDGAKRSVSLGLTGGIDAFVERALEHSDVHVRRHGRIEHRIDRGPFGQRSAHGLLPSDLNDQAPSRLGRYVWFATPESLSNRANHWTHATLAESDESLASPSTQTGYGHYEAYNFSWYPDLHEAYETWRMSGLEPLE